MDSTALLRIISKIPALKHRYLGCFNPNTFVFPMLDDTFQIVNTTTDVDGHWITMIRSNGIYYFGDSLQASSLQQYSKLRSHLPDTTSFVPINTIVKQRDSLCGLYCIYFAWKAFDDNKVPKVLNDFDLYQLFCTLL